MGDINSCNSSSSQLNILNKSLVPGTVLCWKKVIFSSQQDKKLPTLAVLADAAECGGAAASEAAKQQIRELEEVVQQGEVKTSDTTTNTNSDTNTTTASGFSMETRN